MRLLKVTQTYYPYLDRGGAAVKVQALAQNLSRRGTEVTVVTADLGPQTINGSSGEHAEPGEPYIHHKLEVCYLSTTWRYRTTTVNPGIARFCYRRLRGFDMVHIYGLYDLLGPVVAWFCRKWKIPYLVEPIGMYIPIVRSLKKKRLYHRILGRPLMKGAALLIATSELEKTELVNNGVDPEKISVRYNGLNLKEYEHLPEKGELRRELGLSADEYMVLYLGRLSRKKGLDMLLRAFAPLSAKASLVIVGPDDGDGCLQQLERLRVELCLEDKVMLRGPRFGKEKLQGFVDADLFVLPSWSENFGNAAAEAIGCGVPAIVTDRCGIAPIVDARVGIVVPFEGDASAIDAVNRHDAIQKKPDDSYQANVKALRGALESMIRDPDMLAKFRANTHLVKEELSWETQITKQEQIYQQVLKGGEEQCDKPQT